MAVGMSFEFIFFLSVSLIVTPSRHRRRKERAVPEAWRGEMGRFP